MRHAAALPQALSGRRLRRGLQGVALVLIVATLTGTLLEGRAAAATHANAESSFVAKINAERRAAGLRRLAVDVQLTRVARAWTAVMEDRNSLEHNPRLATQVRGDWTRVGENVGYTLRGAVAESELVARLHRAFMESPGHRANILRDYNQVGVGVTVAAGNKMWVTVVFAKASLPPSRRQVAQSVARSRNSFPAAGVKNGAARQVTLVAAHAWSPSSTSTAGPTLATPAPSRLDRAPVLHPATRAEIDRVLGGRGTVYVAGNESHVSARAVRELTRDGYTVHRLLRAAAAIPSTMTAMVGP